MILRAALTLFLAANATAFFVPPTGVARRPFISHQVVKVSLSDPSANAEIPTEVSPEDVVEPIEAETIEAAEVSETAEVLQAADETGSEVETSSDDNKEDEEKTPSRVPIEKAERFTLYVGNLPYGKQRPSLVDLGVCASTSPLLFIFHFATCSYIREGRSRNVRRARGCEVCQFA
jgi:hypothetical protein